MADESEYGVSRRSSRHDVARRDRDDDGFTAEERRELRDVIRLLKAQQKDDRPFIEHLRDLLRMSPDLKAMVDGKRFTAGLYKAIGEFAKWAGAIIALIVAYRTMTGGK